ncbi:metallophosphoesterase [Jeotgalibacillus proteolyticus]|uniref:Phosphoesterase n=1 Tax=Jeotgalibacillus proteolyticus TaxID=2082395 RepID=A0A2S5GF08_9BACL|nr:metallophosphoesterase [Jeotgalibacillus proteolyticus]PPA71569.1 YfcE family phosphodiesterase [Jeotgalibacillus proteolyticus]
MKILVVSDNHSDTERIVELKQRYEGEVDAMLHCGDSELPFNSKEMQNFVKVRGNCDFDSSYPEDEVINVQGTVILLTHGHLYGVKQSLDRIHYRAEEAQASIICFGHSHSLGAEIKDGRLFINPGSILLPRDRTEASYAIIEKNGEAVSVQFWDEKHREITAWSGSL